MSAGGHYNPEGHDHGLPVTEMRHAGDLGNLQADGEGKVRYEITVKIFPSPARRIPSWAAALFAHAKVDDGGQPVGNAGARISCGVISRESC